MNLQDFLCLSSNYWNSLKTKINSINWNRKLCSQLKMGKNFVIFRGKCTVFNAFLLLFWENPQTRITLSENAWRTRKHLSRTRLLHELSPGAQTHLAARLRRRRERLATAASVGLCRQQRAGASRQTYLIYIRIYTIFQ